jgi:hypothetical protein
MLKSIFYILSFFPVVFGPIFHSRSPNTLGRSMKNIKERWNKTERYLLDRKIDWGFGGLLKKKFYNINPLKTQMSKIKEDSDKPLTDNEKQQLIKETSQNLTLEYLLGLSKEDQESFSNNPKVIIPLYQWVHNHFISIINKNFTQSDYQTYFPNIDSSIKDLLEAYNKTIAINKKEYPHLNPIYSFLKQINIAAPDQEKISLITFVEEEYRNPMGRTYLSIHFSHQKLLKYVEFLGMNIPFNIMVSGALSLDPFFLVNKAFKDFIFCHGLIGLQLPDFLSIIPSSGALYLKIFVVTGLILETTNKGSINVLTGTVFCFGFKEYGYVRFEILSDIHQLLKLNWSIVKSLLKYYFSWLSIKEPEQGQSIGDLLQNNTIDGVNLACFYFVRGQNNLFSSDLARFLYKMVAKNIEFYRKKETKRLSKKAQLSYNK